MTVNLFADRESIHLSCLYFTLDRWNRTQNRHDAKIGGITRCNMWHGHGYGAAEGDHYAIQQNVLGSLGIASPIGSPPVGWHEPGVYTRPVTVLLPSAAPGGMSPHGGNCDVTVRKLIGTVHDVSS